MQNGKKKHEQDRDLFQTRVFVSDTNSSSNEEYYIQQLLTWGVREEFTVLKPLRVTSKS